MVKRMLIDATHPEETRVVVVNGTRLEELDVETSTKKQLKGNIYLAKVVRVEPSLQAAFVEYGGNRHGFLAFSEIHPDYFQIPVADRQALLAAQRAEVMREVNGDRDDQVDPEAAGEGHLAAVAVAEAAEGTTVEDAPPVEPSEGGDAHHHHPHHHHVEVVGGGDDDADNERRRARLLRHYKIQEVTKRRQIMLVQVVKEERGNKGAALTTYLSLAGRYCVLMPNTARGGGVSRKIINTTDRRRLKAIANEMDIPDGMAVIIRTAGSERSRAEIRRDYEYLLRMWDSVRELTLKSSAPALVYEEASLIKRSIRDLYSRDIDEVLVDGDEGYRLAKDYMRMLTPSHAKKVQPYRDPIMPMFHRYQVEVQLDAMHSPVVQLKSGGYIVINQTEALVAIDVNSGRATKERHIEETALKTNLEASDEVARQLRLRDLAGLIVIDFIDMEEGRNNHAVERRLKEALKNDRARIQVGKISAFGLLELSRQRLRPSLQETAFAPCPQCAGTGLVRSVESAAVHILRAVEEEGIRHRSSEVTMTVASIIALYILNQKRDALRAIEERYDFRVLLLGDDTLIPPAFRMDRVRADSRSDEVVARTAISMDDNLASRIVEEEAEAAIEEEEAEDEEDSVAEAAEAAEIAEGRADPGAVPGESEQDAANRRRRRRRRRKRKGDGIAVGGEGEGEGEGVASESAAGDGGEAGDDEAERDEHEQGDHEEGDLDQDEGEEGEDGEERAAGEEGEGDQPRNKRRRGRRGGRRRRRREEGGPESGEEAGEEVAAVSGEDSGEAVAEVAGDAEDGAGDADSTVTDEDAEAVEATPTEEKPKRKRAPRKKPVVEAAPTEGEVAEAAPTEEKPKRKRAPSRKKAVAAEAGPVEEAAEPAPVDSTEDVADESVEVAPEQQAEGEAVQAEQAETVTEPGESVQAENSPADEPAREEARSDEGGRAEEGAQPEQEGGGFVPPSEDPAAPSAEEEAPLPAGPPRRGWWNRLMS